LNAWKSDSRKMKCGRKRLDGERGAMAKEEWESVGQRAEQIEKTAVAVPIAHHQVPVVRAQILQGDRSVIIADARVKIGQIFLLLKSITIPRGSNIHTRQNVVHTWHRGRIMTTMKCTKIALSLRATKPAAL
jgi:hypothetical protein